jgi:hypothetical protein
MVSKSNTQGGRGEREFLIFRGRKKTGAKIIRINVLFKIIEATGGKVKPC